MRIVVVDDQASQLAGRVAWLSHASEVDEVVGLTFEQAAAYGAGWSQVQVAVLDGHDRRSVERRRQAAVRANVSALPAHDNFPGVRVAEAIRAVSSADQTVIILISTYARDCDIRARRIAQAGIDYVFEHYEVDSDAETFTRAVLDPVSFCTTTSEVNWGSRGYCSAPDIAGAIAEVERSEAGIMLLNGEPGKLHRELAWGFRTLRGRLQQLLRVEVPVSTSADRVARAPRKAWILGQLRQALGWDLPTDP